MADTVQHTVPQSAVKDQEIACRAHRYALLSAWRGVHADSGTDRSVVEGATPAEGKTSAHASGSAGTGAFASGSKIWSSTTVGPARMHQSVFVHPTTRYDTAHKGICCSYDGTHLAAASEGRQ